jgi:hypothetical protein
VALREVGVFLIIIGGKMWAGEFCKSRDASLVVQLLFGISFPFFLFPGQRRMGGWGEEKDEL